MASSGKVKWDPDSDIAKWITSMSDLQLFDQDNPQKVPVVDSTRHFLQKRLFRLELERQKEAVIQGIEKMDIDDDDEKEIKVRRKLLKARRKTLVEGIEEIDDSKKLKMNNNEEVYTGNRKTQDTETRKRPLRHTAVLTNNEMKDSCYE